MNSTQTIVVIVVCSLTRLLVNILTTTRLAGSVKWLCEHYKYGRRRRICSDVIDYINVAFEHNAIDSLEIYVATHFRIEAGSCTDHKR